MRLAVLCDLLEERWYSMDLLADMLFEHAPATPRMSLERVRPTLPCAFQRLLAVSPEAPAGRWAQRAGIGLGRYVQYPLHLFGRRARFDRFHVVDHSYAHLLLELPGERAGVYCHDVDAFRPLFEESRGAPHQRAIARTVLAGLRRARIVFHSSPSVRRELLEHRLASPEQLVHAPYGVASEFHPTPGPEDAELAGRPPFVLHVGSLIPRKNPDFLLRLAIALCEASPALEFVQVGGLWNAGQRATLERAGCAGRVRQFEHMTRAELAPYYRAARAVVLPSLAEGFGLPVIEALACGASVVVSDLPVLVQVGGEAVVACPPTDLEAWRNAVLAVLDGRGPSREVRLRVAERYSWKAHAATIVDAYAELWSPKPGHAESMPSEPLDRTPHAGTPGSARHVGGLDSIRLICAAWVLFGHLGFIPLTTGIDRSSFLGWAVSSTVNNLVSGPAAVIVFFVISGFCIHYPFRDLRPIPIKAYYSRRYVRILLPMAAAIALGLPLGVGFEKLNDSILWSLLCEEIYYLIYPLVLVRLRKRVSWRPMIAVALALSMLVVLTNPRAGDYASYGPALNWLLGLPCWLLGCELAESIPVRVPSPRQMWGFRLGIWALSSLTSVLRFHSPVKYPWTLNFFAIAVFFWLGKEIAYHARHGGSRLLEQNGKWSYSIYLMHVHAYRAYPLLALPFFGALLDWSVRMIFAFGLCYVFYRLVEKPAHELARRIAQRILEPGGAALRPAE